MKKTIPIIVISLALTLVFSSLTMAGSKVMFSYDMEGKYESKEDWWDNDNDYSKSLDTDYGFSIGYEYTMNVRRFEYGFGFETQIPRSLTDRDDAEFKFSPMYGVFYYHFTDETESPFVMARLGYNLHSGNTSYKDNVYTGYETELGDGMYFATGFGFSMERYMVAMVYSVNYGTRSSDATGFKDKDITYSKFSLLGGFKF